VGAFDMFCDLGWVQSVPVGGREKGFREGRNYQNTSMDLTSDQRTWIEKQVSKIQSYKSLSFFCFAFKYLYSFPLNLALSSLILDIFSLAHLYTIRIL
jgi:hypothetical protein